MDTTRETVVLASPSQQAVVQDSRRAGTSSARKIMGCLYRSNERTPVMTFLRSVVECGKRDAERVTSPTHRKMVSQVGLVSWRLVAVLHDTYRTESLTA